MYTVYRELWATFPGVGPYRLSRNNNSNEKYHLDILLYQTTNLRAEKISRGLGSSRILELYIMQE